ncbi:MAG: gamma-glutamyltransferase [Pseudomonadota bacterium]
MILNGCIANEAGQRTISARAVAVADEPLAVEIGRQIMADGGNAADAAVAMGLALGVTLPSRAGLAAPGACIIHDPDLAEIRILDFASPAVEAGSRPLGEPLALRGLRTLHAAYGSARWATVVAPAERLARLGHTVSRTFAADLRAIEAIVPPTSSIAASFGRPTGGLAREGDKLVQPALADTLGLVRERGAGALTTPTFAQVYPVMSDNSLPVWQVPIEVSVGSDTLAVAPMPATGGLAQSRTLEAVISERRFGNADQKVRAVAIAQAMQDAFVREAGNGNGETALGTSFATLSGEDFAIACGMSLGGLFGSFQEVGTLGFYQALGVPEGSQVLAGLTVWYNKPKSKVLAIGGGSDFFSAATAPLLEAAFSTSPLRQTVAAPRLGWEPRGRNLIVERAYGQETQSALGEAGYPLRNAERLGRAAYIVCDWDRQSADKFCAGLSDPRGSGSSSSVEQLITRLRPAS